MADRPDTGADSRATGVLLAMLLVGAACLVLSFAVSAPSRRKYPDRIEVRMWHMWTAEWKDVVDKIVDRFNESQDKYELVALSIPGPAANAKFLLAVAGDDPPDCMAQWFPVIPKWADSDLLLPLNELMTDREWANFKANAYPIAKKIGIYKGNLYGVTTGLNIWACYYRMDHLYPVLEPVESGFIGAADRLYRLALKLAPLSKPATAEQQAGFHKALDWLQRRVQRLVPLDRLMAREERASFHETAYPVVHSIAIHNRKLHGIITGLSILRGLNFPPKTLEKLCALGRKLNRFKDGDLTRLGFLPRWWAHYVPGFGGAFCDWQGDSSKLTLDRPENLAALKFLVERRKELGFDNIQRFQSGLQQGFAGEWPFISGQYSVLADGQWKIVQLTDYAPEVWYGTAPIPPPAGGKAGFGWSNGNFMIIPKNAKCPAGAWEFIKFWSGLAEPERAAEFYTWGGWLPLSPAIAKAPAYRRYVRQRPQFQTFLDMIPSENIHPTPPVAYQDYLFDRIGQADDSAMRSILTPKEALGRLIREIEIERKRRRETGRGD